MSKKYNAPEEIERGLALDWKYKQENPDLDNLPTLHESKDSEFKLALQAASADDLVFVAYDHYAAARVLFQTGLTWYAMFCGQQMIELYLKAFLKSRNHDVPATHSLRRLLDRCRAADTKCEFTISVHIEAIVTRFDAYNEVGRYPVAKRRPKRRGLSCVLPDTMWELDYFVFKMRQCTPASDRRADPLRSPGRTARQPRLLDVLYRRHNINFDNEASSAANENQPLASLLPW